MKQSTINKEVNISGVGLYSGMKVNLKIRPAGIDNGITFSIKGETFSANYKNIINTNRRTIIGNNNLEIHTVEHLMSALYFRNISNANIQLDSNEPPILDGSAIEFINT